MKILYLAHGDCYPVLEDNAVIDYNVLFIKAVAIEVVFNEREYNQ